MSTTRMSFSYPEKLKEELTELAKQDSRSLSSYIQKVLQAHLESATRVKQLPVKKEDKKNTRSSNRNLVKASVKKKRAEA